MAETEERKRSDVADVLNFDPTEKPWWRERKSDAGTIEYPTVQQMIDDIVIFQREFQEGSLEENDLKSIRKDFLCKYIFHNNVGGSEKWTLEDTKKCIEELETNGGSNVTPASTTEKQEAINIYKAYSSFYEKIQEDISKNGGSEENPGSGMLYGLLQVDFVKETQKIMLSQLEGIKKPGQCSKKERFTTYRGERYDYPKLDTRIEMETALESRVIDRYNSLVASIKTEDNENTRLTNLFKTSSWLLFEFLDLHPFGNGNGRVGRLLCNYALSAVTPFATPIYNIWSQSTKYDYMDALVEARKSKSRHPEALTTMLIECNWLAWKEFNKQLQEQQQKKNKE